MLTTTTCSSNNITFFLRISEEFSSPPDLSVSDVVVAGEGRSSDAWRNLLNPENSALAREILDRRAKEKSSGDDAPRTGKDGQVGNMQPE